MKNKHFYLKNTKSQLQVLKKASDDASFFESSFVILFSTKPCVCFI